MSRRDEARGQDTRRRDRREVARPATGEQGRAPGRSVGLVVAALALLLGALPTSIAAQTMDDYIYTSVMFDELEYVPGVGGEPVEYDGEMWIGGDYDRFWLKAHGEQSTLESEGHLEAQALYSRTVSAFWNAQGGFRLDGSYGSGEGHTRGLLALGMEGLAPYWFQVESFLFVSQDGDVSARLEASYEMLFTQRLVLEPELELNAAVQEVPEWGVGSGLNDLELGARLRYELVREFAPYVGVTWTRYLGETADMVRAGGGAVSDGSLVFGVHWWY